MVFASVFALVVSQYGPYPHTDIGKEVRRIFHKLRHTAIENFNEHFKGTFDGHGQVPTKGPVALSWGPSLSINSPCCIASCTTWTCELASRPS